MSPNLKVADIITYYPLTTAVFIAHGLGALVTEDAMSALSPFLTLGTALRSRFIAEPGFMKLREEAALQESMLEAPGLDDIEKQGDLTLLALMPCGLKMPFSYAMRNMFIWFYFVDFKFYPISIIHRENFTSKLQ